jgi:hypothetical protein
MGKNRYLRNEYERFDLLDIMIFFVWCALFLLWVASAVVGSHHFLISSIDGIVARIANFIPFFTISFVFLRFCSAKNTKITLKKIQRRFPVLDI